MTVGFTISGKEQAIIIAAHFKNSSVKTPKY